MKQNEVLRIFLLTNSLLIVLSLEQTMEQKYFIEIIDAASVDDKGYRENLHGLIRSSDENFTSGDEFSKVDSTLSEFSSILYSENLEPNISRSSKCIEQSSGRTRSVSTPDFASKTLSISSSSSEEIETLIGGSGNIKGSKKSFSSKVQSSSSSKTQVGLQKKKNQKVQIKR